MEAKVAGMIKAVADKMSLKFVKGVEIMLQTDKKKYNLKWIYGRTKGTRGYLLLLALSVSIIGVLNISLAFFLKMFTDIALGELEQSLVYTGVVAVSVLVGGGLFIVVSSVIGQYITGRIERETRIELMEVILSRSLIDISKQHTGELLTKLTIDVQAVSGSFVLIVQRLFGNVVMAVMAIAAMFAMNWKMTLIMLVLTPIMMAVMAVLSAPMKKASTIDKENEEVNRSIMQEDLSRIMLIKAYFMQDKVIRKVHSAYAKKLRSGVRVGFFEGMITFSGASISMIMFMVCLGIGAHFVMIGETSFGNLVAIIQLLNFVVMPVADFAGAVSLLSQAVASAERIGEICELPAEKKFMVGKPVMATKLVAENISFSYKEDDSDKVFEGISASFEKGKITAIAGRSGCGKSTLLKLLIGLYEPHDGKITLNHEKGCITDIMPQVAYVPPVDYLFSGTVTENIIMSENRERKSEVREAAAGANILDFIESLPEGFATLIGESGGTVSSGQAQRLAIARAIYKKSPIVVFDEPTANLDVESIEKFQNSVRRIAADKICIIVTHDTNTLDICDKVYLLADGKIREKGTHEVLEGFS